MEFWSYKAKYACLAPPPCIVREINNINSLFPCERNVFLLSLKREKEFKELN